MVCNVHKEEDHGKIIENLIERNTYLQSLDDIKEKITLIFDKPAAGGTKHYILKCDPEVRELIH
ncbi:hypothetical protein, partial [Klebsiella pneumoniae]|uniref:hypothetical protein n=1 Tax=Klebsiella pneumoniae TaxID=573 RepID=UPI003EBAE60F